MRILQVITKGEIGGTQHKVDGDGLSFLNRDNAIKLLSEKCGFDLMEKFLIGSIGPLAYQENYEFLISIFPEIIKIKNNAIGVIIGEGPERKKYEKLIKKLNLKDKIYLVGNMLNAAKVIKGFDLFVLTSKYEDMSTTLLKAKSSGVMILASDVGGRKILESSQLYRINDQDGFITRFKEQFHIRTPKISVIMSVFNGGKYLKDAIKSILNQTFTDFEFIIINDGSTDESRVVIEQFADPRIKLTNKENKGIVKSLNEAVSYAIGEYIARMDADDISLPERLAKQSEFLDTHPDIGIVGSWAEAIDENGIIIKRYEFPPETDREIRSYLLRHNAFIHPTVMLKRKLISQNPYRNFKHTEDYEVWTRLLQKCKGANIPKPLIKYRVVKSSITRKHQTEIRLRGIFIRLLILFRLFLRLPI